MMKTDLHTHTTFSPDGHDSFERLVQGAIKNGVKVLCVTDHIDVAHPGDNYKVFDSTGRIAEYLRLKQKYGSEIKLLLGLELGEPNLYPEEYAKFLTEYPYDMLIGSVHNTMDRVWGGLEKDMTKTSRLYYEQELALATAGGFEVLGHLDFPRKFTDKFVEDWDMSVKILEQCIKNDITLEVNTSPLHFGKFYTSPNLELVKKYRDMGGKYITISSDAHYADRVGTFFETTYAKLPEGLSMCYYEQRKRVINK